MSSARILDVTPREYFNDPCDVPSLSQSIAHTLVTQSPLHAWTEHPRFGNRRRESTKATDNGSLIHSLLLGRGVDVEIINADNFRTRTAQDQREEAIAAGKLPVLARQFLAIEAAAVAVSRTLASLNIDLTGQSEVAIEWYEQGELAPVVCRGMFDHLIVDQARIIDLKTIRSAHPRMCGRHALEFGYDLQYAAYTSALSKLRPDLAGRVEMHFIFIELEPPYAVTPACLDGMLKEVGHQRWTRAVRTWERCMATDSWPAYADSIVTLEAPAWAVNEELA